MLTEKMEGFLDRSMTAGMLFYLNQQSYYLYYTDDYNNCYWFIDVPGLFVVCRHYNTRSHDINSIHPNRNTLHSVDLYDVRHLCCFQEPNWNHKRIVCIHFSAMSHRMVRFTLRYVNSQGWASKWFFFLTKLKVGTQNRFTELADKNWRQYSVGKLSRRIKYDQLTHI